MGLTCNPGLRALQGGMDVSELGTETGPPEDESATRKRELLRFLVLAFGIWPFVAVCVVGGYGFLVWMYQIVAGPPGPPGI